MAKIKIIPTRSFFDGEQMFAAWKKYSVDESAAAVYIREGWAAEAPTKEAKSSGADGGEAPAKETKSSGVDGGEAEDGGNASGEGGEDGSV
ncbi:hypothetical protein O3682_01455 [Neisseria sp. 27098_8_112]|uniref:hypothetical protein n=1 Tax=Neisseria sp. 27098_8_112 TaxID=3003682 RepID=UPI00352E48E8